jgi:hypothetical protein
MIYQGIVESGKAGGGLWVVWLAAAMLGSALTLASFAKVLHAVFLRKPSALVAGKVIREEGAAMWAPAAGLAFLCVLFGVLAVRLPLRLAIFPAVGGPAAFSGDWWAGQAAVLLGAAYAAGLLFYWLTTARKPRECATYIGGEIMQEVREAGAGTAVGGEAEVTGIDFYGTIEEVAPLRTIYRAAKNNRFDLYDAGTRAVFYVVEMLRAVHTGNLLVYLTWFLTGLVLVLWLLLRGAGVL